MKKSILIIIITTIIISGVTVLYLSDKSTNPITKNVSLLTAILPTSPLTTKNDNWQSIKPLIISDCRMTPVNETVDLASAAATFTKLFDAIGGVTMDPTDYSFSTTDTTKLTSINQYAQDGSTIVNAQVASCWIVWVGNLSGGGVIAYQATSNAIKTHAVVNFPVPLIPATVPTTLP